jgi:gluconolactonase
LDQIIAPGVLPELLATGFNSTEGPLWWKGKITVSDQRAGQIYSIDESGGKTILAQNTGWIYTPEVTVNQGPNGRIADRNGGMLVMRQGARDIGRMDAKGRFTSYLSKYQGKRFNSPNDMVYTDDGTLFFTDPAYSLPGGAKGPNDELQFDGVYSYKAGKLLLLDGTLTRPNGIGRSPDNKTLYVSTASPTPRIIAWDIQPDGSVANKRDFYIWVLPPGQRGGVDGLKVDSQGNIWATGPGGVNVISPQARNLGVVQNAGRGGSNVAFGGPDNQTVYITGGTNLYRIRTLVKGQVPTYSQKSQGN